MGQQGLNHHVVPFRIEFGGIGIVGHHISVLIVFTGSQRQQIEDRYRIFFGDALQFDHRSRFVKITAFERNRLRNTFTAWHLSAYFEGVGIIVVSDPLGIEVHIIKRGIKRIPLGAFESPFHYNILFFNI